MNRYPLNHFYQKLQNLQIFWTKNKCTHAMFLQNKSIFFDVVLTIENNKSTVTYEQISVEPFLPKVAKFANFLDKKQMYSCNVFAK